MQMFQNEEKKDSIFEKQLKDMSRQFTHKKRDTNGPFTYKKMVSITDNKKKNH